MAHARRSGKIMAVGVVDLDNFKPINDTLGHAAGDAVLVEIAQRLRKCLRENDTVARTGGDEFVLLLDGLERAEECDVVMTRLLHDVTQPIRLGADKEALATVSASIGLTLFPQDGADAEVLLRHADQAMYQAKEAGRNRYQLFTVTHDGH
jgi:diguanylate cyclase (GGDEF)-like protein